MTPEFKNPNMKDDSPDSTDNSSFKNGPSDSSSNDTAKGKANTAGDKVKQGIYKEDTNRVAGSEGEPEDAGVDMSVLELPLELVSEPKPKPKPAPEPVSKCNILMQKYNAAYDACDPLLVDVTTKKAEHTRMKTTLNEMTEALRSSRKNLKACRVEHDLTNLKRTMNNECPPPVYPTECTYSDVTYTCMTKVEKTCPVNFDSKTCFRKP